MNAYIDEIEKISKEKEYLYLFKFGFLCIKKANFSDSNTSFLSLWNSFEFNDFILFVHPELEVKNFSFNEKNIIVLGDMFSTNPNKNIDQLLGDFSINLDWSFIDELSGRFSVLVFEESTSFIFNDAFGSSTISYSLDKQCAGSHAALVAAVTKSNLCNDTKKYIKSEDYKKKKTRFLPGDLTMFDGVYRLAPNNYLDLRSYKTARYWPRENIESSNLDIFFSELENYFNHFSKYLVEMNYKPVIGLTGGVDCRALISGLKNKVDYRLVTWDRHLNENEKNIIKILSDYLNVKHEYLDVSILGGGDNFDLIRTVSNINSGYWRGRGYLTAQQAEFSDKNDIFIRGLGGEIFRGMFNKKQSRSKKKMPEYFLGLYLTRVINDPAKDYLDFTEEAIQGFIKRANYNGNLYNLDIGDLYYWEQRMGMWAAELHNEHDPALRNFTGFNSRKLYSIAYGLDDEIRFSRHLLMKVTNHFDSILASFDFQ